MWTEVKLFQPRVAFHCTYSGFRVYRNNYMMLKENQHSSGNGAVKQGSGVNQVNGRLV